MSTIHNKILLIGYDGQLGSDFKKSLGARDLLCPAVEDLDVTNFNQTKEYILQRKPEIVINTAAFHAVDDCEKDPQKTFLVNTLAVKNLAQACLENGAILVHISTDYVFGLDHGRRVPYTEDDLPGPVNIYGISKLASEYCIRNLLEKYFIIRPAALFGVAGAKGKGGNFVETMIRIGREKSEVRVKNDEFTSPTSTKELAGNIAALIDTDHYGLYHITGEGECSWYEFAKAIFDLAKMKVNCQPITSDQFPTIARRPRYSVLENKNLKKIGLNKMGPWQDALKGYLREKGHI